MRALDIKSKVVLDEDRNMDIVHTFYNQKYGSNQFFYTKAKFSNIDFNGNIISNPKNYISIKSIWYADLQTMSINEIVSVGNFDIDNVLVIGDYLYYIKITDKDNDGFLTNDYNNGDIYRINIHNFAEEFCCSIDSYEFFQYEIANEQFLIFDCAEDNLSNMYVIFVDLKNKQKAVLVNTFECGPKCIYFSFILDEHNSISYMVTKKYIDEGNAGSSEDKLSCISWSSLSRLLKWQDI